LSVFLCVLNCHTNKRLRHHVVVSTISIQIPHPVDLTTTKLVCRHEDLEKLPSKLSSFRSFVVCVHAPRPRADVGSFDRPGVR
jgi:hypothetical protein